MKSLPFRSAVLLGAFLLFQVQLIAAKAVLPWFGGAPMVWTTSMLFFQAALFVGYLYAHGVATRTGPRTQAAVHLGVLWTALALLGAAAVRSGVPILPGSDWKPASDADPIASILLLLGATVGLPFLVLATTSPLLQAWSARIGDGRSPYPLYALSNLGAFLALLTYPVLVEPNLALEVQAIVWGTAYAAYTLAASASAVSVLRAGGASMSRDASRAHEATKANEPPMPTGASPPRADPESISTRGPRPGWILRVFWVLLSALGSSMLLACTQWLCQDLAPVPFLWVLPLAIYLGTFILCFHRDGAYSRGPWTAALVVAATLAALSFAVGPTLGIVAEVGIHSLMLGTACMVCHGELARSKPSPRHLTTFYLSVALGGALGGIFVGILAPVAFLGFWEYPIGIWTICLIVVIRAASARRSWVYRAPPWLPFAVMAGLLLAALAVQLHLKLVAGKEVPSGLLWLNIAATLLGLLLTAWKARAEEQLARPATMLGLAAAWLLILAMVFPAIDAKAVPGCVQRSRSFFGTLAVLLKSPDDPQDRALELRNGRVVHGRQFLDPPKRLLPTTYFGPNSGCALAIAHHPQRLAEDGGFRIGAVGLGVGTLACYVRQGDSIRFYEIDPDVVRLSVGVSRLFTFLEGSQGEAEVVLGDARLSLERELEEGRTGAFDLLAVDAFSGGAIPLHLLTLEAFEVYLRHLKEPHGVIALHISNGFLDLFPVVRGLAERLGLRSALVRSEASEGLCVPSTWALVSRDGSVLDSPEVRSRSSIPAPGARSILWTDRSSSLLDVLKEPFP